MASRPVTVVPWWSDAMGHLQDDPKLRSIIATTERGVGLVQNKRLFPTMLRAVCGQQVSNASAKALYGRLLTLCQGIRSDRALAEHFTRHSLQEFRDVGLSPTKALAVLSLSKAYAAGTITRKRLNKLDNAACEACLTALGGIGPWSAQMIMIFGLNRPDILALSDYGVKEGAKTLFGPGNSWIARSESWKPFRTAATWLIWKSRTPIPVVY